MAGYDLVTWAPRVGSSGEDAYNVPGAIKLDGSQDNSNPSIVTAGASAGFSTTPTIAQINASSDFNQVAGLLNRRIRNYNSAFGTSLSTQSYLTAGNKISASALSSMQTLINTLRTTEGFSAYTFSSIAAGGVIAGVHLAEMRKALRISGTMTLSATNTRKYERIDATYGSTSGATESLSYTISGIYTFLVGKLSGSPFYRWRFGASYKIPEWVTGIDTAGLDFGFGSSANNLESFNIEIYSSNSDDHVAVLSPSFNGTFYNLDNHHGTINTPSNSTLYNVAMSTSPIVARAGSYISLIIGTTNELASSGATTPGSRESDARNTGSALPPAGNLVLTLDFGA